MKYFVPIAVLLFLIIGSFSVIEKTNLYQDCVGDYNDNYTKQTKSQDSSTVNLICAGKVIDAHSGIITALATLIIAVFTVVLSIVTNRQAGITRDALIADNRAFVYADGFKSFWTEDKATGLYSWRFRTYWCNSGNTPTKNMTMHIECDLRNSELPDGFNFDYPTTYIAKALIAPKTRTLSNMAPVMTQTAITPQDIIDVQEARKFLYLIGWAKYHDVFAGTPEHITRFCWVIAPMGNPTTFVPHSAEGSGHTLVFDFVYHDEGNCADDECNC